MKKKIERAGLILYHINEDGFEFLFMTPSDTRYGGPHPQIPKGKLDEGETPIQAAIREAQEEVGLFRPNINGDVHPLGQFLKIHMFVAEVNDKHHFGDPHFETENTMWLTPEQFQQTGRDLHRPAVKAAARFVMNKHMLE